MSGPLSVAAGALDGVAWAVRADLGEPMVVPASVHGQGLTPPTYWGGAVPYYGDFQMTPNGSFPLRLVIEFDRPIKQIRTTAQFVGVSALSMAAVLDESLFVGDTFTAAKSVMWNQNVSGTRTLTHEPGFRFVVLRTIAISPSMGSITSGPTFRNTFFFETLPTVAAIIVPEPDLRVPRGAGRLISFHWPRVEYPSFTNPQGISVRPRPMQSAAEMVQTVVGVPPAGTAQLQYRGMRGLRVPGGNGTGLIHAPMIAAARPYQIFIGIERMLTADLDGLDEIGCWRLMALLAFEQPGGPITRDAGLVIAPGINDRVRGGTQAGISLGLRDIDTIGLSTRQVADGLLVEHPAIELPDGFDIEDWHTYELRLLGPTTSGDAELKVLIDEVEYTALTWGPDSVLPPPVEGVYHGFHWAVSNLGGSPDFTTRMYIANGGVELAASMTEDGLL